MSGKEPRSARARGPNTKAAKPAGRPPAASDSRLYTGLAILVTGLAALVWWSIPGANPPVVVVETEASVPADPSARSTTPPGTKKGQLDRPPRASAELAVLTDRADDVVRAAATVSEIAKRLQPRHCGTGCDAVRKLMTDEDGFEIEVTKTEDLILPSKDTFDTVAAGLTPSERETIPNRKAAVVVRTQGPFSPDALPARAAFAAAAVLAEALDGFVYDEVARRIETLSEVLAHTVVAPLGHPAFLPKQIVVQLYRQDDGTARLLTLGMARFGSPDLSLRGANMGSGPLLSNLLNAAAAQIAHGKSDGTITVTLEEIARVVGRKPSELSANPGAARPVVLDVVEPERTEGDPDNELAELVPNGGASRESWDLAVASLYGSPPSMATPEADKELGLLAQKARKELPSAIKRFQAGEGELFVKGPFVIPEDARVDGGASTELLWIAAASCDDRLCTGVLSNEPTYATNIAAGKTTSVKHAEAVDWLIQHRDGGIAGGESIKALRARASH